MIFLEFLEASGVMFVAVVRIWHLGGDGCSVSSAAWFLKSACLWSSVVGSLEIV